MAAYHRSFLAGTVLLAACAARPEPAPTPAAPPPPDLRAEFTVFGLSPRGQSHRPTCSVFTVTSAIEFAVARARGRGERFSVEYLNWAANAATGRRDDGDFFHCALAGYEQFGICADELLPYARSFDAKNLPPPAALVAGGRHLADIRPQLDVRWLRPNDGSRGLSPAQFDDVRATLAAGWPVAVGSAHSRLLVGYRADASAAGGGIFLTLDSGLGAFGEVTADYVRTEINDAFVVTTRGASPAAAARG